jgi:hypothetical protein
MEMSSRDWTQKYEALRKKIQHNRLNSVSFSNEEKKMHEKQLTLLQSQLKTMAKNPQHYDLYESEIARRETLLENIKTLMTNLFSKNYASSQSAPSSGGSQGSQGKQLSQAQMNEEIMRLQDDMVRDIGSGVDRLHGKARIIGEEARAHVRLLDDLDSNVDIATAALQAETRHAAEVREKGQVCYMYICIAVECIVLILLLVLAFK